VAERERNMSWLEAPAPSSLVLSVASLTDRHLLNKGLLRVSKSAAKEARPQRSCTLRSHAT
jgi:hypothetical protein